jgi:hypothetical protein
MRFLILCVCRKNALIMLSLAAVPTGTAVKEKINADI